MYNLVSLYENPLTPTYDNLEFKMRSPVWDFPSITLSDGHLIPRRFYLN